MTERPEIAGLDRLRTLIAGLRAKTLENGCTEGEAMLAAAKVAELLDRHDLSLDEVERRSAACEQQSFESPGRKRVPLDDCIGAIAAFCDCRVWREKTATRTPRYVFFGLRADIEAAHCLAELIDTTIRSQLGQFKTSPGYAQFRHQERHLANASFALGMAGSIGDKLMAMKRARDRQKPGSGRDLVIRKHRVVDAEFDRLDQRFVETDSVSRSISPAAYEAGEAAGDAVPLGGDAVVP